MKSYWLVHEIIFYDFFLHCPRNVEMLKIGGSKDISVSYGLIQAFWKKSRYIFRYLLDLTDLSKQTGCTSSLNSFLNIPIYPSLQFFPLAPQSLDIAIWICVFCTFPTTEMTILYYRYPFWNSHKEKSSNRDTDWKGRTPIISQYKYSFIGLKCRWTHFGDYLYPNCKL